MFGFACNLRIPKVIQYWRRCSYLDKNSFSLNFLVHLFSERSLIVKICFILRYFPPFFSSKRNQIPFCRMQKGISYRMQICENPPKIKVYWLLQSVIASCSLHAQGSLIALGAFAKGNQIHFPANYMQNPRIVWKVNHVGNKTLV
jgi:hypothetical protein